MLDLLYFKNSYTGFFTYICEVIAFNYKTPSYILLHKTELIQDMGLNFINQLINYFTVFHLYFHCCRIIYFLTGLHFPSFVATMIQ